MHEHVFMCAVTIVSMCHYDVTFSDRCAKLILVTISNQLFEVRTCTIPVKSLFFSYLPYSFSLRFCKKKLPLFPGSPSHEQVMTFEPMWVRRSIISCMRRAACEGYEKPLSIYDNLSPCSRGCHPSQGSVFPTWPTMPSACCRPGGEGELQDLSTTLTAELDISSLSLDWVCIRLSASW